MQASNRFKGIRIWIWAVALGCSSPLFAKSSHDKIIYRIGFIHPRSGPLAPFGNSLAQGVKLGLQQFRLENPKLGEQIGLISADDRGLASEGEKAAKRLIQQQKVQLLIGSVSNSVNLSLAAVSNQSETPLLLPRGTDEDMLGKPHIFTMSLTDRYQGRLIALFVAKNLHRDRALLMTDSQSPDSEMISKGFTDAFTQSGGQITGPLAWRNPKQLDEELLKKISSAEASVLVYPGSYRTIPPLLSATRKAGIKSTIIGSDGWDHEKLYAIDANTLGSQYYFSYFHISDPQDSVQNFVNEYETNFGTKPDSLAALGYDSIRAAIQALVLSKTGKPTQLLNSLEGARFPGIYGAGHFSKDHVYLRPYPFIITTGGQPHFMARLMPESN